ncbi:MAG TPA: NUDIX domain-containing protein [Caproicibacter sp.]|nr:NUDIX domain-containing protein [Caproicibacter sp.]
MKYEISCGAVVFTQQGGKTQYVIIKSTEGYYGFPKGHIESGESEEETALREIREETGLNVNIISGFRVVDEHPIPNKPDVMKRIIYFLAEFNNQIIKYHKEELLGAYIMTYNEAMNAFQFDSSKRILEEADIHIEHFIK